MESDQFAWKWSSSLNSTLREVPFHQGHMGGMLSSDQKATRGAALWFGGVDGEGVQGGGYDECRHLCSSRI